ncbi:MAG: HAD family phosphatase [Oscillospiraceae bacterium]|nr:HAD family phosphatase [Oscillospiraceae bacterium]
MDTCKAVIFDLDGVIIDSERLVIECWETVGAQKSLKDVGRTLRLCIGTTSARTREIFSEHYSAEAYEDLMREAVAEFRRRDVPLKPGVRELLQVLNGMGVRLAVASSTSRERVISELEKNRLSQYFRYFVGGDMVRKGKPDPDVFLLAGELCGVRPSETWVIEDSYNGIIAAHRAGMHPLMVPDMLPPTEEMRELADAVFPDLFAVRDWLSDRMSS